MAMAVDYTFGLDYSSYSTNSAATATEYDLCGLGPTNWDWAPVDDREHLVGQNDLDLIESMMDVDGGGPNFNVSVPLPLPPGGSVEDGSSVEEGSSSVEEGSSLSESTSTEVMTVDEQTNGDDRNGLRLVHLLLAAAEALNPANKSRDLARVILVRLKGLVSPADGTNMERLAAYFTEAMQALLDGDGGVHPKHLITHRDDHHPQTDLLHAFQLLQDMSPYVKFGHFTANQAILEAVEHDRRVHIVDYDIMEGIQWASLMQALVSRKDGTPAPHLRITAIARVGGSGSGRIKSISTVQETGRRLTAFAASIGQPFSFHQCRLDSEETFRPSALKQVRGETLVINCMLHLPHFNHRAPESVASFLSGARTLNPRILTLVAEELGHVGKVEFVNRFVDTLHHYSAVYDSLEAGSRMQSRSRALVERVFFGPRIAGSLARIYRGLGEDESCSWGEWLAGGGMRPVPISFANHCQSKLLLGLFDDGYRVGELANNKIALGWKTRRLLSASVWTPPESDL